MRKHSVCEDSVGRTFSNVRLIVTFFCDLIRIRLTFATSNFADEIFFLEEKNYNARKYGSSFSFLFRIYPKYLNY